MTSVHDSVHRERIRAVVADDLDERDPALQRQLSDCAECRSELAGLRRAQGLLDQVAAEEREVLGSLDRNRRDPRIGEFVRARIAERQVASAPPPAPPLRVVPPAPAVPRRRALWVAAAAAAVIAAGWLAKLLLDRAPQRSQSPVLGPSDDSAALSPSGKVASYAPMTWNLTLQPGERFQLVVWDDVEGARAAPRLDTPVDENRWIGETTSWPGRIRWEVRVIDATGQVVLTRRARAER